MVVRGGVEPPTFRFSGGRSYRLSYLTEAVLTGLEPATSTLTGWRALRLLYRTMHTAWEGPSPHRLHEHITGLAVLAASLRAGRPGLDGAAAGRSCLPGHGHLGW